MNPSPDAYAVPAYTQVSATFDRDMNPASIHAGTFLLSLGAVPVPGVIRYIAKSRVAVFSPIAFLPSNSICSATLTTQVRDLAGGTPLWHERTLFRGDSYEFRNRLGPVQAARPAAGAFISPKERGGGE